MSHQPFNLSAFQLTNTFSGKKVLVTGHTGFKGSWLCEWLVLMGAEVSGFSLPELPTRPALFEQLGLSSRIKDQRGDIRNAGDVEDWILKGKPDFLFHLAAQPLVRLSYQKPVETYEVNVLGTIHVLEALRKVSGPCVAVMVTTDKVYENREWEKGYREEDPLGGHDPYSSSKAACEIAIASWRKSFFSSHPVRIASARAGNVIGGGDWALDRIVPDCIRSLKKGEVIAVRNKNSTRPWQHVLEPLSGYLLLAARLAASVEVESLGLSGNGEVDGSKGGKVEKNDCTGVLPNHSTIQPINLSTHPLSSAFNFGPGPDSNRTVAELVREVLVHWPGEWKDQSDPEAPHEAEKLNLVVGKAFDLLGWQPRLSFRETIAMTVQWYRRCHEGEDPASLVRSQINDYADKGPGDNKHE